MRLLACMLCEYGAHLVYQALHVIRSLRAYQSLFSLVTVRYGTKGAVVHPCRFGERR